MSHTPEPIPSHSLRLARHVLAIVVIIQAVGLILFTMREGTPVGTWLFLDHLWPEAATKQLEWAGTIVSAIGVAIAAFAGRPSVRMIAAGTASVWCLAFALAQWNNGGAPFTDLALGSQAARIAAPLLLALWGRKEAVTWILRVSIAATFAIHGIESVHLHPVFIDLILAADGNIFGLGLTQADTELLLRIIGVHDIALALVVLVGPLSPRTLAWMAIWGAITAVSRMVQGGEGALHQTVIRVANGGLPLVLLLLQPRTSMSRNSLRLGGRLARAALPLVLVALPLFAGAQALNGDVPAHLRVVWTEEPAHRATISWSTAAAGSGHEVHLDTEPRGGALGSYAQTVAAGKNGKYSVGSAHYHHAELTGLEPSTTYYFVVVSNGKVSPERHFVTAPVDDRPFRILSGGDSRKPGESDRRMMNELIARLAQEDPTTIGFAHGGDYIQSDDSWSEWDSWMADHALTFTSTGRVLPIIPVRGNHEGDGAMYNDVFGFPGGTKLDYFATQLSPNAVILNLDTNSSIGGDQAKWLEQQLQTAQAGRWIIPSYHRPAYPAVKTPSGAKQFWVPLFEQYNADVVLESDGHVLKRTVPIRNDRFDPTGVVYVGEGGLGVPQRKPNSEWYLKSPGMAMGAHHVQIFSFSPTELRYEAVGMDGQIEDSYLFQPKRTGKAIEPAPVPDPEPEDPGTEPEDPGTQPEDPGTEPEDPGIEPEEPGIEPEEPGTQPEDPGTEPEEPGTEPEDPGTEPEEPGTEPEEPGIEPEGPATGDETHESGGCAAAGGSFAGLGLMAVGMAAIRRRRASP